MLSFSLVWTMQIYTEVLYFDTIGTPIRTLQKNKDKNDTLFYPYERRKQLLIGLDINELWSSHFLEMQTEIPVRYSWNGVFVRWYLRFAC